jgi:hypothetical protein
MASLGGSSRILTYGVEQFFEAVFLQLAVDPISFLGPGVELHFDAPLVVDFCRR